jgi:hypothetical protein
MIKQMAKLYMGHIESDGRLDQAHGKGVIHARSTVY